MFVPLNSEQPGTRLLHFCVLVKSDFLSMLCVKLSELVTNVSKLKSLSKAPAMKDDS